MAARLKSAQALAQRGNPADLRGARTELDALFALEDDFPDAHALAADVDLRLWREHLQPGRRPPRASTWRAPRP